MAITKTKNPMLYKKNLFAAILLIFSSSLIAQNNYTGNELIEKIDSITKVNKIEIAEVVFNEVTTSLNKTATSDKMILSSSNFTFDGQFLVLENTYFNLAKLLYFELNLKKKKIRFYFQAY